MKNKNILVDKRKFDVVRNNKTSEIKSNRSQKEKFIPVALESTNRTQNPKRVNHRHFKNKLHREEIVVSEKMFDLMNQHMENVEWGGGFDYDKKLKPIRSLHFRGDKHSSIFPTGPDWEVTYHTHPKNEGKIMNRINKHPSERDLVEFLNIFKELGENYHYIATPYGIVELSVIDYNKANKISEEDLKAIVYNEREKMPEKFRKILEFTEQTHNTNDKKFNEILNKYLETNNLTTKQFEKEMDAYQNYNQTQLRISETEVDNLLEVNTGIEDGNSISKTKFDRIIKKYDHRRKKLYFQLEKEAGIKVEFLGKQPKDRKIKVEIISNFDDFNDSF